MANCFESTFESGGRRLSSEEFLFPGGCPVPTYLVGVREWVLVTTFLLIGRVLADRPGPKEAKGPGSRHDRALS